MGSALRWQRERRCAYVRTHACVFVHFQPRPRQPLMIRQPQLASMKKRTVFYGRVRYYKAPVFNTFARIYLNTSNGSLGAPVCRARVEGGLLFSSLSLYVASPVRRALHCHDIRRRTLSCNPTTSCKRAPRRRSIFSGLDCCSAFSLPWLQGFGSLMMTTSSSQFAGRFIGRSVGSRRICEKRAAL